jgi:O-antigen/teichoic acid export membrane protein
VSLKRGTLMLMTGWFAILVTGYLLNFFLARWFATESFGNYGFVIAVLMWFEIFVINGIPIAVQKFVSARGKDAYSILWTSLRVQFVLVAVLMVLLMVSAPLFAAAFRDPKLTPYFRLAFLNIPFYGFFHLLVSFQNGLRRFGKQAFCYAFYGSAKLGCAFALCYFHRSLESALIGNALGSAASVGLAYFMLEDKKIHPSLNAVELIRYAAPALAYSLTAQLLMSIDFWSVKYFLGEKACGYYNTAGILSRIPFYLLLGLSAAMLPTISSGIAEGALVRVRNTIRNATRYSLMLLIPVSVWLTVYSREIASLLFKSKFAPSGAAMEFLVWAFSSMALMTLFLTLINADGRPRRSFLISGAAAVLSVVLNLLLIPRMGIRGAALASLISITLGTTAGMADVFIRFRIAFPVGSIARIGFATAGMLAAMLCIRTGGSGFIAIGILGTLGYGGLLLLSGEINRDDMILLRGRSDVIPSAPPEPL